jgi:soluble lytic murein transglycosylase-like protein
VRKALLLLVPALAWTARAEDPAGAMAAALARQRAAIETQRASVSVQAGAAREAPAEPFYTVPWPFPAALRMPPACDPVPPTDMDPLIAQAATREGVRAELIKAVIEKESAWVPCAVSPKGAQGLMQLMPETAADLGVEDAFDPGQNISGGAKFLKQLLARYNGSVELALAAYNAGPGNVDEAGGIPNFPETVSYVSRILALLPPLGPQPVSSRPSASSESAAR